MSDQNNVVIDGEVFDLLDVDNNEEETLSDYDEELIPVEIVSSDDEGEEEAIADENENASGDGEEEEERNENGDENLADLEISDDLQTTQEFEVITSVRQHFPRFGMKGLAAVLKFRACEDGENKIMWLRRCFQSILDELIFKRVDSGEIRLGDRVALVISNKTEGYEPIYITFRKPKQFSVDVILSRIAIITNSKKEFFVDKPLEIIFQHVRLPYGNGKKLKLFGASMEEYAKRKYGIISYKTPKNESNNTFCLAHCIVLATALANNNKTKLKSLKRSFNKLQEAAEQLCSDASVDLSAGGGYEEIDAFQEHLKNEFKITVYLDRYGNDVYYEKIFDRKLKSINLMLWDYHFYTIKNLTAAFATSYYCEPCHKGSSNKFGHICPYKCKMCFAESKCIQTEYKDRVYCGDCNRRFYGTECYANHRKSVCGKFKVCTTCDKLYNAEKQEKKPHKCGWYFCTVCVQDRPYVHDCYMPGYKSKRNDESDTEQQEKKPELFIEFDLETTQNTLLSGYSDKFEHVANVCVASNSCKICDTPDSDVNTPCVGCGERLHVFEGNESIPKFMDYIFCNERFDKFGEIIVIAHNMGMFDGHFLLKHIYHHGGYGHPNIVMNGTKIILLQIGKCRIIDSMNYFSRPLSALPAMFNFPEQNYSYSGKIPHIKYFAPNTKTNKERKALIKWHKHQRRTGAVFNNREELLKYCKMDVEILRKACSIFRKMFWETNKIDPFMDACTLPSACNKVFRANYLPPDTIGIIPRTGYRFRDNQSLIGLKWLCWFELENNIIIEHAGRGSEVHIAGVGKVDGYHQQSNTVYEMLGCYYHGCETCYPVQNTEIWGAHEEQMFARSERTDKKNAKIRELGFNLVIKKECEFRREIKENPGIEICLWDNPLITNEPLNPRHAFYGGRTNANKLHYKCKPGEKIKYLDVTSLYPFCNKYKKVPIKHPKIHIGDQECRKLDFSSINGLIKCSVLPPKNLFFPVLPSHIDDKLMFHLCRLCSHKRDHNTKCSHSDDDRTFVGTWVADELQKAVKKGYKIVTFHEIWEYEVCQYDPNTKTGGVFSQYIDNFIKIKTESSGFPEWCKTPEDELNYIKTYFEREGIQLEHDRIKKNPGLRTLGKTTSTSFWGKFGEREDKPNTEIINHPKRLFNLFTNPDVVVESILPINDQRLVVKFSKTDDTKPLNYVNVAIAAYTTAAARLELYKYLEMLGDRVLYYDTDSIIYVERPGDAVIPTGDFLGDMTNELEDWGPDSFIDEMVSGGPKNYAFKIEPESIKQTEKPEDALSPFVCKVKGIRLNFENSDKVNFESIKRMVLEDSDSSVEVSDNKILRTPFSDIYSVKRKKTYRLCYTKRMRLNDNTTVPWGYIQ